jgi:hypothetical protein
VTKHPYQWNHAVTGDLSINKIKRAPGVQYRIVACKECPAQIGEPCISSNGNIKSRGHTSRRRIAVRKMLELLEEQGAKGDDVESNH